MFFWENDLLCSCADPVYMENEFPLPLLNRDWLKRTRIERKRAQGRTSGVR